MKVYLTCLIGCAWFSFAALGHGLAWGQVDKSADREALPKVPAEFEVTLFASEPLVRQPCSMAFDERGRLFVGMGPQYRNPKQDTPGDSVVLFLDTNGDGKADKTKEFATGFNAIQDLAWHGRDLWIANAPDFTIVRDLDCDDEADEYIKVYTDLGNLEHGLHGLNWAPDGKLYMSKGNSKGLNQPGRYAPKPFRDLAGVTAPADVPDFPAPEKFSKDNYRRAYHDPADDWGLDRGVLRCDEERKSSPVSAMPDTSEHLTPQQVADLTTYLMSMQTPLASVGSGTPAAASNSKPSSSGFGVDQQNDRLRISLDGKRIVDFVFRDDKILRPYFANARLADERQVTRSHPPVEGVDALDHDTIHPGIWLGFGDINGHDFWRNKAAMEHVRFVSEPKIADGRLTFSNECRLKAASGQSIGLLTNDFTLLVRPSGWLLVWSATFHADQGPLVFGDQEEMGFGARVATPFTEKNGGVIRSSSGKKTAKETWGQPATWCDYSGTGPKSVGIQLMAGEKNFRESWWHNRDYGAFVVNAFGREAMKQGAKSAVTIKKGESFRLVFGAMLHDGQGHDSAGEYKHFLEVVK